MYRSINPCIDFNGRLYLYNIECQLEMFDKGIVPIFLYGPDMWEFQNLDLIVKLHL